MTKQENSRSKLDSHDFSTQPTVGNLKLTNVRPLTGTIPTRKKITADNNNISAAHLTGANESLLESPRQHAKTPISGNIEVIPIRKRKVKKHRTLVALNPLTPGQDLTSYLFSTKEGKVLSLNNSMVKRQLRQNISGLGDLSIRQKWKVNSLARDYGITTRKGPTQLTLGDIAQKFLRKRKPSQR